MLVASGVRIGGYRLLDRIGAGGMGEVWRAVDDRIGRQVAIKFLTLAGGDSSFVERFRNEARIHARLSHPNIATLFSYEDRPLPHLVMELIAGPHLSDWAKSPAAGSWQQRLRVFAEIAGAVGHLHANGVVHRDIKIENVRLSADGRPKLLDFGIARDSESARLTQARSVIGTIKYLGPERLEGAPADARSDVWALGVLLYELLTGRAPFDGEGVSRILKQMKEQNYRPPSAISGGVPEALDDVIAACLQPEPRQRPQDARRVAALCAPLLGGTRDVSGVSLPFSGQAGAGRLVAGCYRYRVPLAAAGVALAGIAALATWQATSDPPPGEPAPAPIATAQSAKPALPSAALRTVRVFGLGGQFDVYRDGNFLGRTGSGTLEFQAAEGKEVLIECRAGSRIVERHKITAGPGQSVSCQSAK